MTGDARQILTTIPGDVFQTCVTSPPYWSLRDYAIEGQIGSELSLPDYIASLVAIFEQVRRTMRDDGTLWLNIGDSYTAGGRTWRAPDKKNPARAMNVRPPTPEGLKAKDLIGVPWRLAFALQEAGWYLRDDCIWHKPNAQPESVKDRPTRAHEYVFLLEIMWDTPVVGKRLLPRELLSVEKLGKYCVKGVGGVQWVCSGGRSVSPQAPLRAL